MQNIKKSVGKGGKNEQADVKVVQELLNSFTKVGGYSKLKEDGLVGKDTLNAIGAFQQTVMGEARPDKLVEPGKNTIKKLNESPSSVAKEVKENENGAAGKEKKGGNGKSGEENISGLKLLNDVDKKLKDAVILFAEKYGGPITVTSGRRTLAKQAELMAPMNDKQLNMYGKGKAPYVVEIKKLEKRTAKDVEKILAKYWPSPCFISGHLSGKAVDISRSGLNTAKADKAAAEAGLEVFDDPAERSLNCYHVSLKKASNKA